MARYDVYVTLTIRYSIEAESAEDAENEACIITEDFNDDDQDVIDYDIEKVDLKG